MKRYRPFLLVAGYIASLFLTVQSAAGAPGLAVENVHPVSRTVGSPVVFLFPDVRTNTSGTGTLRLRNPNTAPAQGITIALLRNDGTDSASQVFTIPQASQQVTVGGAWEGTPGEKEIVINFSPPTTGIHEAVLKVTCSQNPEISSQQYTIKGTGTEPLISVLDPANNVLAQTPVQTVNLPAAIVGNSSSEAFRIENAGAATGTRTATLEITHDDAARSPFQVLLTATGNGPGIIIRDPSDNLLTYSTGSDPEVNLGSVSGTTQFIFTIENNGNQQLNINSITTTGADSSEFVVSASPNSVPAASGGTNGSETFTVTFSPTAIGSRTTTLEISHDDIDDSPFRITLNASGTN